MIPVELMHSPSTINDALRHVLSHYVGQPVTLAIRDYGSRKRSGLEGTITDATASGLLLTRSHGGREYISYMDLYARHVTITAPATLVEDIGDALAHLGVRRRHGSDGGRGKARLPVGPAHEGFHHVKTLVR